jgi:nucleotide-binding universal stress UspA family protein
MKEMTMLKILIPVDGSSQAQRAVNHVLKLSESGAELEIHLLNVQIPIASGHARMFVDQDELETYHREEGLAALADARNLLDSAGITYAFHIVVGHVAESIVRYAKEHKIDKIVMGTHGRGGLLGALLGSVAHDVLKQSTIPVSLVK